jgi:PhzF family phenazine biosynthesis protein
MTFKLTVYTAFSKDPGGGNPAGIVENARNLSRSQMQKIAHIAGYSETVFIFPSHTADYSFRYFTPDIEVPACGHATLAGLTYLKNTERLKAAEGTLKTQGGILRYKICKDIGCIFIQQRPPLFGPVIPPHSIADSLGIRPDDFAQDLPVQCTSTGLWDIIVPLRTREILMNLSPDMDQIKKISQNYHTTGYHVFTPGNDTYTAYCRNFAPAAGIEEEAATGTASGALAAYLNRYGLPHPYQTLRFRQGDALNRPSEIDVLVHSQKGSTPDFWVGGHAVPLEMRTISF